MTETLDICLANYSLNRGNGIDVTIAEFARELAKAHNVQIAVIKGDIAIPGVEVVRYPASRPWRFRAVARDLDRQSFDCISSFYLPFDAVATLTRTPHLLHDCGVAPLGAMLHNRAELALWAEVHAFRLFSARKAAIVLPISDYLGRCFRKYYRYRGPMEVLPAGIEFPENDLVPAGGEFGKFVLYVGRHTPYKGVDQLMDIFGEVKKEAGDDVHLVTIGRPDAGYGEYLAAKARRVGNVHMLGYVPDVWPYYAGATVYATCSAWEGEDRPVIEAQYMGKPAVSYANCSHPEVVFHGTLARDRDEFKGALARHLTEARTDLSARSKVVERFSIRSMARAYLEIAGKLRERGATKADLPSKRE